MRMVLVEKIDGSKIRIDLDRILSYSIGCEIYNSEKDIPDEHGDLDVQKIEDKYFAYPITITMKHGFSFHTFQVSLEQMDELMGTQLITDLILYEL